MMLVDIPPEWLFPPSLKAASTLQRQLATQVLTEDKLPPTIQTIGGADVSNNLRDPENWVYAALVVLSSQRLAIQQSTCAQVQATLPYVPGFLAFRETPALIQAYQQLRIKPDVILVDGHGISHPRRLGIASHLGVLLDCPTIGVAKSILVGKVEGLLGNTPGDTAPLIWQGQTIGVALRTKANVQPVYVSSGHRISLKTAVTLVMKSLSRYRLPEATRQAHLAANVCRKQAGELLAQPSLL